MTRKETGRILIIQLPADFVVLKALASDVRLRILEILRSGEKNVNEIKNEIGLPQSTVATNIMLLQKAKLIETRSVKAAKGTQKICSALYDEFVIGLPGPATEAEDAIEVEMPIGLFIEYSVSPPCVCARLRRSSASWTRPRRSWSRSG
jgi:predicted transcriptional regulator